MAETDTISRTDTAHGNAVTRGVHHLALTTEDMKVTTEFYVRVVGMPLVHAMKVPPGMGSLHAWRAMRPVTQYRGRKL